MADSPQPPRRPAPQIQPVFIWPTPEESDRLFFVERDGRLPKNQNFTYGDAYSGPGSSGLSADYKLVYVSPQTEDKWSRWFYAKDRTNEDDYNFQHSTCDLGGRKFDAVQRTYMTLRSAYSATSPAAGAAMPTGPSNKFTGYILAGREQRRTETEIDALYVFETRTYVKRVTITTIGYDRTFGVPIRSVTTLYYKGETFGATTIQDAFANKTGFGKVDDAYVTGEQLSECWYSVTATDTRDSAIAAYSLSFPSYASLSLPNVLLGISIVYNEGSGDGEFLSNWEGESFGTSSSLSGSESASSTGSGFIQPEPVIDIQEGFSGKVPTTVYVFYKKSADVQAAIDSYGAAWPNFYPQAHTLVLLGQSGSVSAKASASAAASISGGGANYSWDKNDGAGVDRDFRSTTQVVRIPPTIHGSITITGASDNPTLDITARCECGWPAESTWNFPAVDAFSEETITIQASVSPTSLPATNGATSIPTGGNYVLNASVSPFEDDWVKVAVEVLDAADLGL